MCVWGRCRPPELSLLTSVASHDSADLRSRIRDFGHHWHLSGQNSYEGGSHVWSMCARRDLIRYLCDCLEQHGPVR
jgi:hypothetical protein